MPTLCCHGYRNDIPDLPCIMCVEYRRTVALAVYASFATSDRRHDVANVAPSTLAHIAFAWADAFIAEADKPKLEEKAND